MSYTDQTAQTIEDFGSQWTRYTDNSGYYGSKDLLADIIEPLVPVDSLKDLRVAEIGSGSGRIILMLMNAGVKSALAIEPSEAMKVVKENTLEFADRIEYLQAPGEKIPKGKDLDLIVSIGVLHHIPDPAPVVKAAKDALKNGGEMFIWLYGKEGNEIYLLITKILRAVTTWMPDSLLGAFSWILDLLLDPYIFLCKFLHMPMKKYFLGHYAKLSRDKRRLTIFDQLNPAYAKYYTKKEAYDLLANAGFKDITLHHRHGYSWSVKGTN